jgi:hypothetical protein
MVSSSLFPLLALIYILTDRPKYIDLDQQFNFFPARKEHHFSLTSKPATQRQESEDHIYSGDPENGDSDHGDIYPDGAGEGNVSTSSDVDKVEYWPVESQDPG